MKNTLDIKCPAYFSYKPRPQQLDNPVLLQKNFCWGFPGHGLFSLAYISPRCPYSQNLCVPQIPALGAGGVDGTLWLSLCCLWAAWMRDPRHVQSQLPKPPLGKHPGTCIWLKGGCSNGVQSTCG